MLNNSIYFCIKLILCIFATLKDIKSADVALKLAECRLMLSTPSLRSLIGINAGRE